MRAFLLLLFVLPLAPCSHADPHDWNCFPATGFATGAWEITSGTPTATFYLDDRNYLQGNGWWMYEESNGIWTPKLPGVYSEMLGADTHADLQRGGSSPYIPNDNEICYDDSANGPDQLIF